MRRSTPHIHRRHGLLWPLAILLAVAVCGTGTALAMNSSSAHHRSASRHARAASAVAPTIASQLSVFNAPATSADALPSNFSGALQAQDSGVQPNVANARKVIASDGQASYLVPSAQAICAVNTNEAFCTPTALLPGAAVVDLCSPTLPIGQLELEWLLPDGATNVALGMSDGTTSSFASGANVYIARLPFNGQSPIPKTIEWNDSNGQHHSVETPIPSGAQGQTCMHPPAQATPEARHKATRKVA